MSTNFYKIKQKSGLTFRQISEASGVASPALLEQYASGRKSLDNAGLDKLVPLAEALDVKLWELLDDPQLAEAVRRVCL